MEWLRSRQGTSITLEIRDNGETVIWNATYNGDKVKGTYNVCLGPDGMVVCKEKPKSQQSLFPPRNVPAAPKPISGRHQRRMERSGMSVDHDVPPNSITSLPTPGSPEEAIDMVANMPIVRSFTNSLGITQRDMDEVTQLASGVVSQLKDSFTASKENRNHQNPPTTQSSLLGLQTSDVFSAD